MVIVKIKEGALKNAQQVTGIRIGSKIACQISSKISPDMGTKIA